jgi:hypothetical protein
VQMDFTISVFLVPCFLMELLSAKGLVDRLGLQSALH